MRLEFLAPPIHPEVKGMHLRRCLFVVTTVLAAAPAFAGERVATDNFVVDAPTRDLARKFADAAEYYRKEKAMEWLGQEMPTWKTKCPLKVIVTMGAAGGATTFTFDGGPGGESSVASREMEIKGKIDQLLDSVLPHEVTHTVLAHYFGRPVPRWADEGGSVLSENDDERYKHDISARELLNQGRGIKLKHLFAMKEYPRDMIVTYAEGYSVVQFLVDQGGRKKFLEFVASGMKLRATAGNWGRGLSEHLWIPIGRCPGRHLDSIALQAAGADRGPYAIAEERNTGERSDDESANGNPQ